MKKCPSCDKTYEDSMRFCQVDGTPLVDDAPAFDPFATIVGAAPPKQEEKSEAVPETPFVPQPEEPEAISEPDDVLEMPDDPLKTMYVSEDEMRSAMKPDDVTPESGVVEIKPIEESAASQEVIPETEPASTEFDQFVAEPEPFAPMPESPAPMEDSAASVPEPEPPSFNVPDVPAPDFSDISPPPSPFSTGSAADRPVAAPSFGDQPSDSKSFNEAETVIQPGYPNPFDTPPAAAPIEEWTPPPVPASGWENQQVGSAPPESSLGPAPAGQNKILPIVSLVLGILSLCCYVSPITGIAAVITGFMGMKNANSMPNEYGGKGLAIAGMIIGGLMFVVGIVYWVFLLFFGGMAMIMDAAR
jgi:hypothetical protein